jgi:hypothetical protein
MTFAVTQRVSTIHGSVLDAGRRAAGRFLALCQLTAQERANLYVSQMSPAVITASLGGRPYCSQAALR